MIHFSYAINYRNDIAILIYVTCSLCIICTRFRTKSFLVIIRVIATFKSMTQYYALLTIKSRLGVLCYPIASVATELTKNHAITRSDASSDKKLNTAPLTHHLKLRRPSLSLRKSTCVHSRTIKIQISMLNQPPIVHKTIAASLRFSLTSWRYARLRHAAAPKVSATYLSGLATNSRN